MPQQSPQRTALIRRIKVALKELRIPDDAYRAMLVRVTGKDSCGKMGVRDLNKVFDEMKRQGFKLKPPKRTKVQKLAPGEQIAKIRSLWLSLWQLGAVREPAETAMEKYAVRMTGVQKLQWLQSHHINQVINSLYSWLAREGWEMPDVRDDIEWRIALIHAQSHKLDLNDDPDLKDFIYQSRFHKTVKTQEELDHKISQLGQKIRKEQR